MVATLLVVFGVQDAEEPIPDGGGGHDGHDASVGAPRRKHHHRRDQQMTIRWAHQPDGTRTPPEPVFSLTEV